MAYITLSVANTFISALPNSADWDALTDAEKDSYLAKATARIESIDFVDDGLVWDTRPRWTRGFNTGDGTEVIPTDISNATALLAFHYVLNPLSDYAILDDSVPNMGVSLADLPLQVQNVVWKYMSIDSRADFRGADPTRLLGRQQARPLFGGESGITAGDGGGGSGSGLSQSDVDARVRAGVLDWAEQGNTDQIPADKLGNAGGAATDQVARDAAGNAQTTADTAISAINSLDSTYSTDAERNAAVANLQAAIDAIGGGGEGTSTAGTQVFVDTQQPTGGVYRLDDIWIRDVAQFQIYKWTGTVWSVTFTLQEIPDIDLLAPGAAHGNPTQADYDNNKVIAVDGQWFYVEQTGHLADSAHWTWADLNDGQNDLNQFRGIVDENPFSINNPVPLDWSYILNEQRWVRYASSTWQYQTAPANFNSRFRTQNAAQRGGFTTVGKFIYDHNKNAMRIIRAYNGAVPGAPTFAYHAFQGEALDLEDWAFSRNPIQVQPRKLAIFPAGVVNSIPNSGEKTFALTSRVHKNATGDLTSYDLADWAETSVTSIRSISQAGYDAITTPDASTLYLITS